MAASYAAPARAMVIMRRRDEVALAPVILSPSPVILSEAKNHCI